jgi:hypothetical protein
MQALGLAEEHRTDLLRVQGLWARIGAKSAVSNAMVGAVVR